MRKILYDLFSIGPFHFNIYQGKDYEIDPKKEPVGMI